MSDEKKPEFSSFLSWVRIRDISVICLIVVFTWKLLNSDISINIEEFGFTDLLSMIIAFFSIGLSVAFYFKASETSNLFYDNSYKFTKDVSEILGRIEAGFGEKLKHIDEGYAGIRSKFEQFPFDMNKAKEDIEEEKREIEKKKKEQSDLLETLAEKAKLAEAEKSDLFSKMEKTNEELELARNELRRLQRTVINHEADPIDQEVRRRAINYLLKKISNEIPEDIEAPITPRVIRGIFENIKHDIHTDAAKDLVSIGSIDDEGNLTNRGVERLWMRLRKR